MEILLREIKVAVFLDKLFIPLISSVLKAIKTLNSLYPPAPIQPISISSPPAAGLKGKRVLLMIPFYE